MTWVSFGVGLGTTAAGNYNAAQGQQAATGALINMGEQGIAENKRQFNVNRGYQQPWLDMGKQQLPMLQSGAGSSGYQNTISSLLASGQLNPMIEQQQQQGLNQLSNQGLKRSGYGVQQMANIPTNVATGVEGLLANRQQNLAGMGQTAGVNLGALRSGYAGQQSSLLNNMGANMASGTLAQAQNNTNTANSLVQLGAGVGEYYR